MARDRHLAPATPVERVAGGVARAAATAGSKRLLAQPCSPQSAMYCPENPAYQALPVQHLSVCKCRAAGCGQRAAGLGTRNKQPKLPTLKIRGENSLQGRAARCEGTQSAHRFVELGGAARPCQFWQASLAAYNCKHFRLSGCACHASCCAGQPSTPLLSPLNRGMSRDGPGAMLPWDGPGAMVPNEQRTFTSVGGITEARGELTTHCACALAAALGSLASAQCGLEEPQTLFTRYSRTSHAGMLTYSTFHQDGQNESDCSTGALCSRSMRGIRHRLVSWGRGTRV